MNNKKNIISRLMIQAFFVFFLANTYGCKGCKSKTEAMDGNIILEVLPTSPMIGDQKTFKVIIRPENQDKIALFKNFKLSITLADGGANSTKLLVRKQKATKTEELSSIQQADLSDFFKGISFEPGDEMESANFTLVIKDEIEAVTATVSLLNNETNQTISKQVNWEEKPLTGFKLEYSSKQDKEGIIIAPNNKISIDIKKEDPAKKITKRELEKLKLRISRRNGISKRLDFTNQTGDDVFETINDVSFTLVNLARANLSNDEKSATLYFTVDNVVSNTIIEDNEVSFSFELLNQKDEKAAPSPCEMTWENGAKVTIKNAGVVEDPGTNTLCIEVELMNDGQIALEDSMAYLEWDTQNPDILLKVQNNSDQAARTGTIQLPKLDNNNPVITHTIKLEPTFQNTTVSGNLQLKVVWDKMVARQQEETKKNIPIHNRQIDLKLEKLGYDVKSEQIFYQIKNNGNKPIDIKARFKNNEENNGAQVEVNETALNINGNTTITEDRIKVNFNAAEQSDFLLELLYGDNPVNFTYNGHLVGEAKIHCNPREIKLEFIKQKPNDLTNSVVKLNGNEDLKFKFNVPNINNVPLKKIDVNKIELHATKTKGSKEAKLLIDGTENMKLSDLNKEFSLQVIPGENDKEVKFEVTLQYSSPIGVIKEVQEQKLSIEWNEYKLDIVNDSDGQTLTKKINDGKLIQFRLKNNNKTDKIQASKDNLKIILESNSKENNVKFVNPDTSDLKNGVITSEINFKEDIDADTVCKTSFNCQVMPINGKLPDQVEVTIKVQRDNHVITLSKIEWNSGQNNKP